MGCGVWGVGCGVWGVWVWDVGCGVRVACGLWAVCLSEWMCFVFLWRCVCLGECVVGTSCVRERQSVFLFVPFFALGAGGLLLPSGLIKCHPDHLSHRAVERLWGLGVLPVRPRVVRVWPWVVSMRAGHRAFLRTRASPTLPSSGVLGHV